MWAIDVATLITNKLLKKIIFCIEPQKKTDISVIFYVTEKRKIFLKTTINSLKYS